MTTTKPMLKPLPFGNPDGYGSKGEDPLKEFVSFDDDVWSRGIAMRADDRTVRIIVGCKGAGKTIYLRRLQASASDERSLYADDIQRSYPRTHDIVLVGEHYERWEVLETWRALWKIAILRSLASHLLRSPRLAISSDDEDRLRSFQGHLFPDFQQPFSVYSQLGSVIYDHGVGPRLDRYMRHPDWDELEYTLGDILERCPPVCFYLDAIDEDFGQAPRYWRYCQLGLFQQVLDFMGDSRIGGRLHIVICVRDIVYSSKLNTEHLARYSGNPHIHVLEWDREVISEFLRKKLDLIDRAFFASRKQSGSDAVRSWLGVETVYNPKRRLDEEVESYLIRHTRLIPRDIVSVGNELCKAVTTAKRAGRTGPSGDDIRLAVKRVAAKSGREQLLVAANHVASELMPQEAARFGYDDLYTGEGELPAATEHHEKLVEVLRSGLLKLGVDRFGPRTLDRLRSELASRFDHPCDILSILWQNRLLGYIEGPVLHGDTVFYAENRVDDVDLPLGKRGYATHPIVIDAVEGIKGKGSPVMA